MIPALVADIGNTRIKWARCADHAVVETCSLPPDDPAAWQEQWQLWTLGPSHPWAVAGVHPARRDRLIEWLREQGATVLSISLASQLPLTVALERPDWAGIDRLLDAVAANHRRQKSRPSVIIDAGSAVTVDWLDENGVFCGGAILPGARLMAKSLHDYTALLPEFAPVRRPPPLPGKATIPAMEAGVYWAIGGGVRALCEEYSANGARPDIFVTGGDGPTLVEALDTRVQLWPEMTLEGIRLSAEALP